MLQITTSCYLSSSARLSLPRPFVSCSRRNCAHVRCVGETKPNTSSSDTDPQVFRRARARQAVKVPTIDITIEYSKGASELSISPAVEQTVRSLARDIVRLRYTRSLFQPDVKFKDGFRSFTGVEKYGGPVWYRDELKRAVVRIKKVRMEDNTEVRFDWEVAGQLQSFLVRIQMESVFKLNQLTGRVEEHSESWNLRRCSPVAALAVFANRVLWSAKQASLDASEQIGKVTDSLSSFSSMDEESIYRNPNDPTKFFQQQDNTVNDLLWLCTGVAILYLFFKTFEALETLG